MMVSGSVANWLSKAATTTNAVRLESRRLNMDAEARSRMRALDWARAGIKTAQLIDSSRSPNILFSIF